jgi:hypothetical protein
LTNRRIFITSGGGCDGLGITFVVVVVMMASDVVDMVVVGAAVSFVVIESTRRVRSVRDEIGMNFELNVGS